MTPNDPSLEVLSPLDGRYRADVAELLPFFAEAALHRYRVRVEVEYLIMLSRVRGIGFVPPLDVRQAAQLRALYQHFDGTAAAEIAQIERRVRHDIKAVEYWLRDRLVALDMAPWVEAVHFALTSEDVNNLAYALLVREARDAVLLPALYQVIEALQPLIASEADTPLLGRTHGQPATPTTFGKELAVFGERLRLAYDALAAVRLSGKLTGATGTFAAHVVALPHIDWPTFSRAFVRSFQLEPMLVTTQIEPHDTLATLCDAWKRCATIGIDLSQDLWRYVSDGYLVQATVAGEVGSSTMPHKVNPIDFENAEGNFGLACALFEHFSRKLPVSRLQRDLSDSTVLRNLGVASGHLLVGLRRMRAGLARVSADRERMLHDVVAHPEVLAEAFQTILRVAGHPAPYEALRQLSRGRHLTLGMLRDFVATLDVAPQVRDALLALTPDGYTGAAAALARQTLRRDRLG